MQRTMCWERKGHLENVYNNYFIVSQEPQGKKRKKRMCRWKCFLDTKMLKIMNNTLN